MNETNEKKNVGKSTGTSGRYRKTPAKKTAEAKTTVETKRASEKPAVPHPQPKQEAIPPEKTPAQEIKSRLK